MEIIFWLSIFLILYCYFGYPAILIILGLFQSKKIKKTEIIPSITLLIPVYNEEKFIRKKIDNSLDLDYPKDKLEIVVTSESDDKTNEIVKGYKNRGVKLFAYSGRDGKQFTIYRTIHKCSGEIIVFTDANSMFKKDAIKKLVVYFNEPNVGCVSGELKYVNPKKEAARESEGLYWKYEIWIKKLESKIMSVLGANGSIYAIRKNLYSPISKYRGDDFELPIRIIQQGYGSVFAPEAFSFESMSKTLKEEFNRKIRIVGWVWRSALILLKDSFRKKQFLLIFQLICHKVLRWLVGIFLIIIFISSLYLINKPLYLCFFFAQVILYSLSVLGYLKEKKGGRSNKLINIIYYFIMINLASILGILKSIFGKQGPTWQKVR
ncbi:MAG: glycosyltransferase family 2 protein [Promethearchaeota archaeon]